jgi:hypothetical protein
MSAPDFQARRVGPMGILDNHQDGTLRCEGLKLRDESVQGSLSALLRCLIERAIGSIVRE